MEENSTEELENAIIPRSRLFVLLDGTFAVRWSENRVQELESGHYRTFEKRDFGAFITDYELNQLKNAGLVRSYDRETVWLQPLPDRASLSMLSSWEKRRVRSYYVNTTLPGSVLRDVQDLLEEIGLADTFTARVRDDFVVLWGTKGISFHKFDDAEKARVMLAERAPDAFGHAVVAFVETTRKE
ncbi:MAG: hypothetical protein SF029_11315 [bacterium]|nr:hypothetical protein [bacterium]